ncbi:ribonucleoside-diphosphate reductase subunit alpha [Morganella psychrotolerans]|uniref:Ribonucleoside-diphosphate reductase n=1 Tax=Morganella psychrotolerans TaxID=368603 RepID=A0A5M9QYU8_9GAMM|nr:class 1a ribonucleoside-diphosphate reductase subunit alpha [Morganella psychrotolerans]KAA8712992.1 ribonucleoside-diphosphate reductase subunit alpha [Morganella psychrotolerans]OBU01907.1 ribonucleoside-diphosphate reductase subunit alpha [Morganella psychrotolerans]
MTSLVTKRDGSQEPFDTEKFNRVAMYGTAGISGVSASAIAMKVHISAKDGIRTTDIHSLMVKAAADLISAESPNYSQVAARLNIGLIRKEALGQYGYPALLGHIQKNVFRKVYDKDLLKYYSVDEINELGEYMKPERDELFGYAATVQLRGKYLAQNRVTGELHEAPQHVYMLASMCFFQHWEKPSRMQMVKEFYDAVSMFKLSLPTPIMSGLRTQTRQFSSCVVMEAGDSLPSINATANAIVNYVSQRAGIGLGFGAIRALGSEIRGGEANHTGTIPFLKYFQAAVKSCSQGGVRGGAATAFYPLWHREAESLLVLKNNRGVEENRVRHMDYGVMINGLLYKRLIGGGKISLFSPNDVPSMYDAFFADQDEFARLYEAAEADESIERITVPAVELFSAMMQERASTGRIYIANVDHMNTHGAFRPEVAPVRQSNLCMEIALPTKPLEFADDPDGEISLCTLSAINFGAIESLDELEHLSHLIVAALDSLLDYQNYPMKAAERSTRSRRSLGVGATNLAYYLAKNGYKYSDTAGDQFIHDTFEAMQYYLLKASNHLAKCFGACPAFGETRYASGELPIDHYRKQLDTAATGVTEPLKMDWEALRADIRRYGLRNSTVSALMPCETSSQITNSTNGIEPPRGAVTVKMSKEGAVRMVVPEYERLKDQYEYLWEMGGNKGYLTKIAIMQKFVDQAISANTNYDPEIYPNGRVPMEELLRDLLLAYSMGVKTLYYHNTRDRSGEEDERETPTAPAGDDCGDSCKI